MRVTTRFLIIKSPWLFIQNLYAITGTPVCRLFIELTTENYGKTIFTGSLLSHLSLLGFSERNINQLLIFDKFSFIIAI